MKKMENNAIEPRPLDISSGWEKLVNGRAAEAEADRLRHLDWVKQQEANRRASRRIQRLMTLFALAVALITAGGVYLNYVDGFPMEIAVSVVIFGNSLLMFLVGWIFGHKARR